MLTTCRISIPPLEIHGDNNSTMHSIPWNLPIASKSKRGSMTSMTRSSYQGHLHRVTKVRKTNSQVCHALDFFLISTQDLINCLDIMITTVISKSTIYSLKVLINLDFSLFFHILKSLIIIKNICSYQKRLDYA